jgi:hypothetical protein
LQFVRLVAALCSELESCTLKAAAPQKTKIKTRPTN